MKRARAWQALAWLTLATLVFTAACSTAQSSSNGPLKIGAVLAISGFNSPLGAPERDTLKLLEEQINAKGGINGRKVEMVIYDTESDETKALTLAKKLIQEDKVLAIIGPTSTGESLALVDTVEKEKVPMISCAASIKIVQPVKPYVFKTPQSDSLAVDEIYAYLKKKNLTKVAILTSTGGFGATGKDALQAAASGAGIQIVAAESFGDTDTDMTTQVAKIKGSAAQALIVWGTNPGPAIVTKNAKQVGLTIPIFQSHGIANQQFLDLAGDAANGVIFPAGKLIAPDIVPNNDPQKPVLDSFAKDFKAKYNGTAPSTFAGHAYDAMMLLKQAIEKGGADRSKIRDELEKIKSFPGTGGVFNMSPTDHNGLGPGSFLMVKVVNGKWTVLND